MRQNYIRVYYFAIILSILRHGGGKMKDTLSRYTLRVEQALLDKLGYIAEYEGRTKNRELEQMIKKRIAELKRNTGKYSRNKKNRRWRFFLLLTVTFPARCVLAASQGGRGVPRPGAGCLFPLKRPKGKGVRALPFGNPHPGRGDYQIAPLPQSGKGRWRPVAATEIRFCSEI